MRRAHRRLHVLLWLAVAPAAIIGLYIALNARPAEPTSDLPETIAEEAP